MVERQEHPVPPEPGLEHLRPPELGEAKREVELRPIAEELITALESEDRKLKIEAVIGVLSRFELKKPHFGPKPGHPKPGHPLPHELGHHPPEPKPGHPRPPVSGEHPEEPPRHPHPRP